jgi:hypothetical protein
MSERALDLESMLRQALSPVDPPQEFEKHLQTMLGTLVEKAADELEAWEISSMRDPRNWAKPISAALVGSAAAAGLIVIGIRRHHVRKKKTNSVAGLVSDALLQAAESAQKHVRKLRD